MDNRIEFIKLQIASFVSQAGSHFLTIALAGYVFVTSHSIVKASLIFVLSYFPSILVSSKLGTWIDQSLSRKLLARNELFSAFTSAVCGLALFYKWPLVILCGVLSMRSLLLFVGRTAGIKWVKLITPAKNQTTRIKYFYLSFFLSTAVAGIMAATILEKTGIITVVIIDVVTYIVSYFLDLSLNDVINPIPTTTLNTSTISTLKEILEMAQIRKHFIAVCLSQAIFQGAYSVLVSYLPLHIFQRGLAGVGPFQFAASLGITLGFVVVSLWNGIFDGEEGKWPFRLMLSLAIGSLLYIATATILPTCLFMFFSMNLAYECIWLFNNAEFFKNSPNASIGRYQFTLTSTASFLMAVATLSYSVLIENYGIQFSVISMLSLGMLTWHLLTKKQAAQIISEATR